MFYTAKVNSRARMMMTDRQSPNFLHTPGFPLLLAVTDCSTLILAAMGRKYKTQSWDWAFIQVTNLPSFVMANCR